MKPARRAFCFFLGVLAVLTLPAWGVAADTGADKRYALPGHGFLSLKVPARWTDRVEQDSGSASPTLSFGPVKGKAFIVNVTPRWETAAGKPAPAKDELRKRVEHAAEGIRLFAVEKDIKVQEFTGVAGPGYYFLATDKAPQAGGYKFMTRGALLVGDVAVDFTILTNGGQDAIVRSALDMLKGAAHVR